MENEINYTGIRVSKTTKTRMSIDKGKLSFNDYLVKILDYLDATSVDVNKSPNVPLNVLIKDQISRVIEVTRGVEKKQNNYLKSMLDLLLQMNKDSPKSEQISAVELTDEQLEERGYVNVGTFQDFIQNNEKLQEQYRLQSEELAKLKKQIKEQPAQGSTPLSIDKIKMLEAVEMIDTKKNTNVLDTKRYQILKGDLDMCLKVLTEEIQKL